VAAVEYVGDVVDLLAGWGGVARGGPQVEVPEPGGDGVCMGTPAVRHWVAR
jgi:hypothetical protein